MNRKTLFVLALTALASLLLLASCNKGGGTADTTASDTAKETEAVTAIPRYDYMDAEVAPDVEIDRADYTDLTLTIPNSLRVTKEDVDAYILNILFNRRTAVDGTTMVKDKAVQLGDDVYIYYKGTLDGKEVASASNWDDESPYKLGLGSGSFVPGFEDALVGLIPNQTSKTAPVEFKVTFPEDYSEDLAGKEVVFRVVIEYAVQYTLPEYNRSFVEDKLMYEPKEEFYASDAALMAEFEEYVHDYLVSQNQTNVENAKIDALWNHLTEKATCKNHPQAEVSFYYDSYLSEAEYYFEYYTSMGNAQFIALYPNIDAFVPVYFGFATGSDWKEELTKMATLMVERDMITHAIAELEGLETVTEEEFNEQVQYWIDYYLSYYYTSVSKAEIIQNMGETFLIESAFSVKLDNWLMEQVTFTYEDGEIVVTPTEEVS